MNTVELRLLASVTGCCSRRNSFIILSLDYKFIWPGRCTFVNIITAIKRSCKYAGVSWRTNLLPCFPPVSFKNDFGIFVIVKSADV